MINKETPDIDDIDINYTKIVKYISIYVSIIVFQYNVDDNKNKKDNKINNNNNKIIKIRHSTTYNKNKVDKPSNSYIGHTFDISNYYTHIWSSSTKYAQGNNRSGMS